MIRPWRARSSAGLIRADRWGARGDAENHEQEDSHDEERGATPVDVAPVDAGDVGNADALPGAAHRSFRSAGHLELVRLAIARDDAHFIAGVERLVRRASRRRQRLE